MSGLFKSKKAEPASPSYDTLYDPFKSSREKLNSFLTDKIGKPGPAYEGERVAPASDIEKQGLEAAQRYADQPAASQSLGYAEEEIKKTLSGDYDPSTSPYYQAVKAEAERNLQKTQKNIADQAAGGRRYFSGARLKAQANAAVDTNIGLDKTLGQLAENERQRMIQVLPQALATDSAVSQAEAKKSANLQQLGALPRELQQALNDAVYQQFLLSEYDYPLNIAQLSAGLATQQPIFVQQGYTQPQASTAARFMSLFQ